MSASTRRTPPALDQVTLLLQLARRARKASTPELPFIMVNETRQLFPYRQAAVIGLHRDEPVLEGISGLSVPDAASPYAQWLIRFFRYWRSRPEARGIARIDFAAIATEEAPDWLAEWGEWLPAHGLWAPLADGQSEMDGALLLFREQPFTDSEGALFTHLAESYGQSYCLAAHRTVGRKVSFSKIMVALVLLAIVLSCIPVRQSLLAPAEITARRPALVRSGLEGIVERILVLPNQPVRAGDPLARLDDTQLRTRLAVARKAEEMAEAEYRQLLQAALQDPATKQRIPLAIGRKEQLRTETAYLENQMSRIVIHSPIDGVALCDSPDEWLGRPVNLGQRIMLVAAPDDVELQIQMPVGGAIPVEIGDEALFYPNITPNRPIRATLTFAAYRATEQPGSGMAYTLRADLNAEDKPMLGLRGMVKLYGERRPLLLNILAQPIMAVRQWLGL